MKIELPDDVVEWFAQLRSPGQPYTAVVTEACRAALPPDISAVTVERMGEFWKAEASAIAADPPPDPPPCRWSVLSNGDVVVPAGRLQPGDSIHGRTVRRVGPWGRRAEVRFDGDAFNLLDPWSLVVLDRVPGDDQ